MTIKDLKPAIVWNNFETLTKCPRPSKHEEIVRKCILDWCKEHNVDGFADETGNIIMRVPATPGYENRKGVILQAHMDMVPQKTADSDHDFLKDPIQTVVDGDWIKANKTTLGADNGLGVAMAMAVAESKDLKHGPVECLITYDEETGMSGAKALKPGLLQGDILLNLDSEDELELCIGCAGGLDAIADFKYKSQRTPAGCAGFLLSVKGLSGGHSGMDISLYRANANKIIVNTLIPAMEKCQAQLVSFTGGSLRNAIPFEAEAEVVVPAAKAAAFTKLVNKAFGICKEVYKESDPAMNCQLIKLDRAAAWHIESAVALNACKAISVCPSNVIRMSRSMDGLTETSINLAVVRTGKGHLTVGSLLRSAVDESKDELARRVKYIFEFAGAKITFKGGYSGWVPKPGTPMIQLISSVHEQMFGKPMNIMATHGGLECALLGAKYPNWEMVSIGPTIMYPHSPDEKAYIPSVNNAWELLKAVLEQIPVK